MINLSDDVLEMIGIGRSDNQAGRLERGQQFARESNAHN